MDYKRGSVEMRMLALPIVLFNMQFAFEIWHSTLNLCSLVHQRQTHSLTLKGQLQSPVNLTCIILVCGRKLEYPRWRRERSNSTYKHPISGIKTKTMILFHFILYISDQPESSSFFCCWLVYLSLHCFSPVHFMEKRNVTQHEHFNVPSWVWLQERRRCSPNVPRLSRSARQQCCCFSLLQYSLFATMEGVTFTKKKKWQVRQTTNFGIKTTLKCYQITQMTRLSLHDVAVYVWGSVRNVR